MRRDPKDRPRYKYEEYTHFIYENTDETRVVKGKNNSERQQTVKTQIEIPFENIKKLNLNNRGENVPEDVRSVINVSRYMLYYWGALMGHGSVVLFLHLREYTDEYTDICYPKISELCQKMNVSRPTLNNYIKALEEHNFIVVVHRLNNFNENKQTSPLFKLRRTVPMLSIEQVEALPKALRKKHDEFLERYGNECNLQFVPYEFNQTLGELTIGGEKMLTKRIRDKIERIVQEEKHKEYLMFKLLNDEFKPKLVIGESEFNEILEEKGFSKPSREAYFPNTILVLDYNKRVNIVVGNEECCKALIEDQYTSQIRERLGKALEEHFKALGEEFDNIRYFSTRNYIYEIERHT